jgi:hypothetical protein
MSNEHLLRARFYSRCKIRDLFSEYCLPRPVSRPGHGHLGALTKPFLLILTPTSRKAGSHPTVRRGLGLAVPVSKAVREAGRTQRVRAGRPGSARNCQSGVRWGEVEWGPASGGAGVGAHPLPRSRLDAEPDLGTVLARSPPAEAVVKLCSPYRAVPGKHSDTSPRWIKIGLALAPQRKISPSVRLAQQLRPGYARSLSGRGGGGGGGPAEQRIWRHMGNASKSGPVGLSRLAAGPRD